MARINTSVSLDPKVYEKLQTMAKIAERSLSQQMSFMIKTAEVKKQE